MGQTFHKAGGRAGSTLSSVGLSCSTFPTASTQQEGSGTLRTV